MDKEKQIEEITEIIRPFVSGLACEEESGSCEFVNCQYCRARDVARKIYKKVYRKPSEEGAECPTCHGTGRIGTTDWLTKGLSKKQLAEEKAKAIAEHEQHIKQDVAREIFEEIDILVDDYKYSYIQSIQFIAELAKLKKKYTKGGE